MFRHLSLALALAVAAPALAARPPASENQRSDLDRRLTEEGDTYGVVTQVDRESHTLTVRKLGGELVTYDFGTMNLNQDVTVGSTVKLEHGQDGLLVTGVESVDLMHDVGVVTKVDVTQRTVSIRQLGGEVVEYEYADVALFDPNKIKVGERVDITHEPGNRKVLFVDLADRNLEAPAQPMTPEEKNQPLEPQTPPEG